jgi:aquaporin Z
MINPKTITETIGTALLVFTIQVAVASGSDLAPVAIGSILIAGVFAGGPVSGAHYNPAVSLAIALRGSMTYAEMVPYMIAQIVGGVLGGLLGGIVSGSFATVAMGGNATLIQALLAEVVVTLALCFVVLSVATNPKVDGNHYYGLAIGLVVVSGAVGVGGISGGAFNPAVALGLSISGAFSNLVYGIMVSGANLVGGAIAAGYYLACVPEPSGSAGERTPLTA